MSEFLKETDKLLGKAVKSLNDNLFTDTDKGANGQEEEKESVTPQKEVEKPTQKKTAQSTTKRLKSTEGDEEPPISEELKEYFKTFGRASVIDLFESGEGRRTLACVVAFILIWIFAGFWWAVAVVILGLVIWAAIWVVKKMM